MGMETGDEKRERGFPCPGGDIPETKAQLKMGKDFLTWGEEVGEYIKQKE